METAITEEQLAKAAKAPRVSKADVERAIRESEVSYTVLPNGRTTVCQIELFGGRFSVEGQSACVSKENFNATYGENHAFDAVQDKVWEALGCVLGWRLSKIDSAGAPTGKITSLRVQTYVGTKVVHAVPMTWGDFLYTAGLPNNGRRDMAEPGYLVEYTDGGAPNVEGFDGYISWSPKDVFERSYTTGIEPRETTWLERLQAEVVREESDFMKLSNFISADKFTTLPAAEQRDLVAQRACMEEKVWLLKKRLKRATGTSM